MGTAYRCLKSCKSQGRELAEDFQQGGQGAMEPRPRDQKERGGTEASSRKCLLPRSSVLQVLLGQRQPCQGTRCITAQGGKSPRVFPGDFGSHKRRDRRVERIFPGTLRPLCHL